MQTISVRWAADAPVRDAVADWLRIGAAMVRTGYTQGEDRSAAEIEAPLQWLARTA